MMPKMFLTSNTSAVEWYLKRLDMNPEFCKLLPGEASIDYRPLLLKSNCEEDCLGAWTFSAKDKE